MKKDKKLNDLNEKSMIDELLYAIQSVSGKLQKLKAQEVENLNVKDFSVANFRYLEELNKLGNPSFAELTDKLGLSKPTVTVMVNKLIDKGLIRKMKSQDDGRVYYLNLTDQGQQIINAYEGVFFEFKNQIAAKFNAEELETLAGLLKRI